MFKKIKRALLKRKLREAYLNYLVIVDQYSCGLTLAEHINGRLVEARERVNSVIREVNAFEGTTIKEIPVPK